LYPRTFKQKIALCAAAGVIVSVVMGCNSTTGPSTSPPPVLMAKGQVIFQNVCVTCHGPDGKGFSDTTSIPGYDAGYPPLYNSDFIKANRLRPVYILFLGAPNFRDTQITVNGHIYANHMPAYGGGGYNFSDSDIAGVLTYVRATFDGENDYIQVNEVASIRDTLIADCKENMPPYCDTSQYVPSAP
jgi:mono/diheme cytochrome c family protein